MARVLIVEDEELLRETLAKFLVREGHEVITAECAREAFDRGLAHSPSVLIADWMLKNHFHGLHVSEALKSVNPSLHTILITSFPSADLLAESDRCGVLQLLEKPFQLKHLQEAVDNALDAKSVSDPVRALAVVEANAEGEICFASPKARHLFEQAGLVDVPARIDELFPEDFLEGRDDALTSWLSVRPLRGGDSRWLVRARSCGETGGWLYVLCLEAERECTADPRIGILLDHRGRIESVLAANGPVVVIESDGSVRRLLVSQIERFGALCYPADDLASALKLLAAEPRTRVALLDLALPGMDARQWVSQIKLARPEATVVGIGGSGNREELLAVGVDRVLPKPWRIADLMNAMSDTAA